MTNTSKAAPPPSSPDPSRRNFARTLIAAFGSAALLEACASAESAGVTGPFDKVATALSTGTVVWYDTINGSTLNALSSHDSAGTYAGEVAIVAGRSTSGDGGGGLFYWDPTSSDTADNALVVQSASLSGRWKRLYSGPIDVRWFGAQPGAGNVATEIANAASATGTGGSIFFPAGSYELTSSLTFAASVTLEFEGGAMLAPATGTTTTILGPLAVSNAGQIFAGSGAISFGTDGSARSGNTFVEHVNPKWWGAKGYSYGTGTPPTDSDSTAAFQSALNTNKSVFVPEGVYYITSITLVGRDQALFGPSLSGVGSCLRSTITSGAAIVVPTNDNQGIYHLYISNANSESNRQSIGIKIVMGATLRNVFVDQFWRGIVGGAIWATHLTVENCTNMGLLLDHTGEGGSYDSRLTNFWIAGCELGICVTGGASRHFFDQGIVSGHTTNGIYIQYSRDCAFNNVTVNGCGWSGVRIDGVSPNGEPSWNNSFQNCYIYANGTADGQYGQERSGIEIRAARATKVVNCSIFDQGSNPPIQKYGIYLGSSCSGALIANNILSPNLTAAFLDDGGSGTFNRFHGNVVSNAPYTLVPADDVSDMRGTFVFNKQLSAPSLKIGTNSVAYGSSNPNGSASGNAGDIVWNSAPSAGGKVGWVCTGGSTWKAFGLIDS